jgi:hypothetical protein
MPAPRGSTCRPLAPGATATRLGPPFVTLPRRPHDRQPEPEAALLLISAPAAEAIEDTGEDLDGAPRLLRVEGTPLFFRELVEPHRLSRCGVHRPTSNVCR